MCDTRRWSQQLGTWVSAAFNIFIYFVTVITCSCFVTLFSKYFVTLTSVVSVRCRWLPLDLLYIGCPPEHHGWRKWTEVAIYVFIFKAGLSATETLVLVQKPSRNETMKRSNICGWYSQFWDGRELVDDEGGGHPKSTWIVVMYKELVPEGKIVKAEVCKCRSL